MLQAPLGIELVTPRLSGALLGYVWMEKRNWKKGSRLMSLMERNRVDWYFL